MHPQFAKRYNTSTVKAIFPDPPTVEQLTKLMNENKKIKEWRVDKDDVRKANTLTIRLHRKSPAQTKGELQNTFTKAYDLEDVMLLQGVMWAEHGTVWNGFEWK